MRNQNDGRDRSSRVVRRCLQDRVERASTPTPDRREFGDLHDEYCGGDQNQAEIEALRDELGLSILFRTVGWCLIVAGALLIV